jgi:hypothetical protein
MSEHLATIATAIIGAVGAWFAARAHRQAKEGNARAGQINAAVNDRSASDPKLYELVLGMSRQLVQNTSHCAELVGWKRSYDDGPLDTGDKVVEFVGAIDAKLDEFGNRLEAIEAVHTANGCRMPDEGADAEPDEPEETEA